MRYDNKFSIVVLRYFAMYLYIFYKCKHPDVRLVFYRTGKFMKSRDVVEVRNVQCLFIILCYDNTSTKQ